MSLFEGMLIFIDLIWPTNIGRSVLQTLTWMLFHAAAGLWCLTTANCPAGLGSVVKFISAEAVFVVPSQSWTLSHHKLYLGYRRTQWQIQLTSSRSPSLICFWVQVTRVSSRQTRYPSNIYILQPYLGDPKAFPSQTAYVRSPSCLFWVFPGVFSQLDMPRFCPGKLSPNQMPELLKLCPGERKKKCVVEL